MIERLQREEARYGEPEYSRMSDVITRTVQKLSDCLDQEGRELLLELEDAFQTREAAVTRCAFRDGFCCATLLALEVWEYHRKPS